MNAATPLLEAAEVENARALRLASQRATIAAQAARIAELESRLEAMRAHHLGLVEEFTNRVPAFVGPEDEAALYDAYRMGDDAVRLCDVVTTIHQRVRDAALALLQGDL